MIPAPRAVVALMGFKIQARSGDAVVIEAIEPAVQLDQYFSDLQLRGEPISDHLKIVRQIRDILQGLAKARLGHEDLHLGNFLLKEGKVYLLDGYAVRLGGLLLRHLLPATWGFVVVQWTLLVPAFIVAEATLSYVGLGFPDPIASWGEMLHEASSVRVLVDFPWLLSPAAAVFVVVLALNLLLRGRAEGLHYTRPM